MATLREISFYFPLGRKKEKRHVCFRAFEFTSPEAYTCNSYVVRHKTSNPEVIVIVTTSKILFSHLQTQRSMTTSFGQRNGNHGQHRVYTSKRRIWHHWASRVEPGFESSF